MRRPILIFFILLNSFNAVGIFIVTYLKPSLLQLNCKEACGPISFFQVSRPDEVARNVPLPISEWRVLACLLITMNLSCWPIFISRQILEKDMFQ